MTRLRLLLLACLILTPSKAPAGDPEGRWKSSPLKPWFNSLASPGGGPCCSQSDGHVVDDPDWESREGHYRVKIDGEWIDVPDDRVLKLPNEAGRTMVWPYYNDGHLVVRCFIPGVMM
jgi:hypothetical protein